METGDPLDPIDWNGAATFSRPGFDGAFALSWQSPPPLTASSKSSPKRPYAKRFLRAFEYLDMRDGLPFAEQSGRSGSRLEFGGRLIHRLQAHLSTRQNGTVTLTARS